MYTRALRNTFLESYACGKSLAASKYHPHEFLLTFFCFVTHIGLMRFQYPHDYVKPVLRSNFPGAQHMAALQNAGAAQSVDAGSSASVSAY